MCVLSELQYAAIAVLDYHSTIVMLRRDLEQILIHFDHRDAH